jgi:hypothetical protein
MTSALPDHPDLELEKKRAKALLKAYRAVAAARLLASKRVRDPLVKRGFVPREN